jgi:hypothetical protein
MSPPAVPLTVVGPVLVIPDPASTAKFEVEPRFTVGCAAFEIAGMMSATSATTAVAMTGTMTLVCLKLIFESLLANLAPP